MKRVIKFRAWNPVDKKMIRADEMCQYGTTSDSRGIRYGFDSSGVHFMMYEKHIINPIQDFVLMQFTGLLDKNGKEIYEGDIVRLTDGGDVSHHRIYFDDKSCRWLDERLEDGDSLTCYDEFAFVKDAKVIGNIYENPDLLK